MMAPVYLGRCLNPKTLKNDILYQQHLENQHIRGDVLQWQPRKV